MSWHTIVIRQKNALHNPVNVEEALAEIERISPGMGRHLALIDWAGVQRQNAEASLEEVSRQLGYELRSAYKKVTGSTREGHTYDDKANVPDGQVMAVLAKGKAQFGVVQRGRMLVSFHNDLMTEAEAEQLREAFEKAMQRNTLKAALQIKTSAQVEERSSTDPRIEYVLKAREKA